MQMNAQVNMQMDAGQGWSVNPRNGVQQAKQDMWDSVDQKWQGN